MSYANDKFNMGNETTRVLVSALAIAGGVGLTVALGGAAPAAIAASPLIGIFGNAYAGDLFERWRRRKLEPRYKHPNHDLTKLVGDAIEGVLRGCADALLVEDKAASQWCDQLAKSVSKHWVALASEQEPEGLKEVELPDYFSASAKSDKRQVPILDEATWRVLLEELRQRAGLKESNTDAITFAAKRLYEGLFHEIRERAKLDFAGDGLAYAALMLDTNSQILSQVQTIRSEQAAFFTEQKTANETLEKLPGWIHTLVTKMLEKLGNDRRASFAQLEVTYWQNHNEVVQLLTTLQTSVDSGFARVEAKIELLLKAEMRAKSLADANRDEASFAPPTLAPEELEIARELTRESDKRAQLHGFVRTRDSDHAMPLLEELRKGKAIEDTAELMTLEGDLYYGLGEYDKALEPYETAQRLKPEDYTTNHNLALALVEARLGDQSAQKNRAKKLLTENLKRVEPDSREWVVTKTWLGIIGWTMPTGDRSENIQRGIGHLEDAVAVSSTERFPEEWAKAQNNLGNAWRNLPTGDRGENIEKAIACYEAALEVRTRTAHPVDWASTQINLGSAWWSLPTGDRGENIGKAIACYEAALEVHTRTAHPVQWAMAQWNLAVAWATSPNRDRKALLTRAVAAEKGALEIITADTFPHEYPNLANNLDIIRSTWLSEGHGTAEEFDAIPAAE